MIWKREIFYINENTGFSVLLLLIVFFSALNHLIGADSRSWMWKMILFDVKQGTVVNLNILFHILIQVKQLFSQSFMNCFENHDLPFLLSKCNNYLVAWQ